MFVDMKCPFNTFLDSKIKQAYIIFGIRMGREENMRRNVGSAIKKEIYK